MLVLLTFLSLAVSLALAARVRDLARRLAAVEGRLTASTRKNSMGELPPPNLLAALRVEIAIRQDHPLNPFEVLLTEALAKEGVVVDAQGETRIGGTLKGNGYADVYFDADLSVETDGRFLFKMRERPPHGDRPENLAREVVARLKAEMEKRERRGALRELGQG